MTDKQQKVADAIGDMIAFPDDDHIGATYDWDADTVQRHTLRQYLEGTHIHERAEALIQRAAAAALTAMEEQA